MIAARWRRISELVQAAIERPAGERHAYLSEVCGADSELQQEVESLLSAHGRAADFLERAVGSLPLSADGLAVAERPAAWRLAIGARLGHFEILGRLGAGGMGEVYRARDTRLNRTVAIKILPAHLAAQPELRRRLEREAVAISGLNHPNICTLHDVGHEDGIDFLVMEHVDGETVRERLTRGALKLDQILRFAIEIADALDAAHAKGIIHRDLKPGNVMLTKSGVKLLDFGVAKLGDRHAAPLESTGHTRMTGVGTIVGTLPYMAPEQLEGRDADARTDIFAFGATAYEMATGQRAFQGTSDAHVIAAILEHDPVPMTTFQTLIPAALDSAVRCCLAKNPDDRWQSCRDLAAALKKIENTDRATSAIQHRGPTSSSDVADASWSWRAPNRFMVSALVAVVATVLIAVGWSIGGHSAQPNSKGPIEWRQLTSFAESATSPVLSRDGRLLAFIRGSSTFCGPGQLYVKVLPDGEPVQLTNDATSKWSPTFSPDGSRITYTVCPAWDTWVVPLPGGQPRLLLPNASGLTWIGDRRLLFAEIKSGRHMGIVTANESRSDVHDVYLPRSDIDMAHQAVAFPDGRTLVTEMDYTGWLPCRLVALDGGWSSRRVGPSGAHCTSAAWLPNGTWMYFSASTDGKFHLWRQRFPDGAPEQVTFGASEEEGIAVIPDGRSIITSVGMAQRAIWTGGAQADRRVSSDEQASFPVAGNFALRRMFAPNGNKLYYLVHAHGRLSSEVGQLWATELESGRSEPLLPGFLVKSFDISRDGRQVVFSGADSASRSSIWLASVERRICHPGTFVVGSRFQSSVR